jgi:dipeptidyl aminopeptidase/acylaminoacyl peptidase
VKTGQAYKAVADLELAPDGRVAYVAATQVVDSAAHGGGAAMLVVAGVERPGSCGTGRSPMCMTFATRPPGYTNINIPQRHVAWSPDGKGVAWVQSNAPDPGITVMVNGKPMGLTYVNASELRFSPDGRRFAYLGTAQTGFFQVIDGQETQASSDVPEFQWSPDGKRYAFQANGTIVVDGKEMPRPKAAGVPRDSFVWSPDSKHFAYAAAFQFFGESPVVDGEVKPLYLGRFAGTNRVQPMINFPPFLFSPDGSHLAYVGYTYDAQGRGNSKAAAMVDGVRYEGPTPNYMFPAFSPDGRHFATVISGNSGWAAMLDGRMSPSYEDILLNNVASARFVSGHEYRFYGVKGGQIYRVNIGLAG